MKKDKVFILRHWIVIWSNSWGKKAEIEKAYLEKIFIKGQIHRRNPA